MIWHVLTVAPQKEWDVRDKLHELRFSAFVPIEFKFRRTSFSSHRQQPIRVALMPGYVLAGFREAAPWHVLRTIAGLRGVCMRDGVPGRLTQAQVDAIEMMSKPLAAIRTPHKYKIGERVKIRRGAMAEISALVTDLQTHYVEVSVDLLGKPHRIRVKAPMLETAA